MNDPRVTGISSITGKIVLIRHAERADAVNIRTALGKRREAGVDLQRADAVVALENERMIGFAVLEKAGARRDIRCLTLVENGRRRGIGLSILRHMLEHASEVRSIVASRAISRYLNNIGFHREGRAPACGSGRPEGRVSACCGRVRKGLAVYGR
jgi:N-acetylglutamate synthase-like GNAT family acetyltransferase